MSRASERFDVVVVGARCAGAPLAALLARAGASVALVEQAVFPRDTVSTHIFQAHALAFLDRLGATPELAAAGATVMSRMHIRQGDLEFIAPIPQRPTDVGGASSVRRHVLDPILAQAAVESGAELRTGTAVVALTERRGRVGGVRVAREGGHSLLEARLVIGADGRNSTVARLAGARKYNVTSNQRFGYWAYFEGADPGPDPAYLAHRWSNRNVIACPADSGLYQVIAFPDLCDLAEFRRDLKTAFIEYVSSCEPVAEAISKARRPSKLFGMLRWEGYFRDASGPGWVLTGDAGHFKDPAPGQGIGDAFEQAEALARAIAPALRGTDRDLDAAAARWGRWRDREYAEHYWLAADMGMAGSVPTLFPAVAARLLEQGRIDLLLDIFNHRSKPSQVATPARVAGAIARQLARRGCDRPALLREVAGLTAREVRRRRMNRHPVYVSDTTPATRSLAPSGVVEART